MHVSFSAIKTEHQNICAVHIPVLYAATLADTVIKVCMNFFLSTLFFSSYSSLHLKIQEKPTIMTLIRSLSSVSAKYQ